VNFDETEKHVIREGSDPVYVLHIDGKPLPFVMCRYPYGGVGQFIRALVGDHVRRDDVTITKQGKFDCAALLKSAEYHRLSMLDATRRAETEKRLADLLFRHGIKQNQHRSHNSDKINVYGIHEAHRGLCEIGSIEYGVDIKVEVTVGIEQAERILAFLSAEGLIDGPKGSQS
jgi:PHD/YefM family antitoxin component YafN of YafNO toxin-antitoxin module